MGEQMSRVCGESGYGMGITMTPEELDAIEARAVTATEGPWRWDVWGNQPDWPGSGKPFISTVAVRGVQQVVVGEMSNASPDFVPGEKDVSNASFIAHARTDVPALVAEVKRLREALTPFAAYAAAFDDSPYVHPDINMTVVFWSDCERARAALAAVPSETVQGDQ